MDGEEGSGIRLSKRFAGGKVTGGLEVDYKAKAGTAWSHSYLNQKPWHPLSYPNQRRKWIAEQTHAQRERRSEEVAREFAQEQEFFRQTALISKKDREKVETMKAVSFMYVRPPGYNAESAKAAEIADEVKKEGQSTSSQNPTADGSTILTDSIPGKDRTGAERKKPRPKDVFGRPLPTEEEFEILKNAPRMETGVPARVKPFGVEVRNVKCLRCGNYGHQSGDRECPLKDAIMPNEEVRLKRDDPLTAIIAHTDPSEPLKWELKQQPGLSPPRGGFKSDDPNQQIVAEDIFDEYGGFLGEDNIPIELLTNISADKLKKRKSKKSKKYKKHSSQAADDNCGSSSASEGSERRVSKKSKKHKRKKKKQYSSDSQSSEDSDSDSFPRSRRHKRSDPSETFKSEALHRSNSSRRVHSYSSEEEHEKHRKCYKRIDKPSPVSEDFDSSRDHKSKQRRSRNYASVDDYNSHRRNMKGEKSHSYASEKCDTDKKKHTYKDLEPDECHRVEKRLKNDASKHERHHRSENRKPEAFVRL